MWGLCGNLSNEIVPAVGHLTGSVTSVHVYVYIIIIHNTYNLLCLDLYVHVVFIHACYSKPGLAPADQASWQ